MHKSRFALALHTFAPPWFQQVLVGLRAKPLAVLAIYALTIYVGVVSLYNVLMSVAFRLSAAAWAFPGDKTDPFYELGTSLGFWGMLFFGLNFVLATRWYWVERVFGGLDQVYRIHGWIGKVALSWLVLHMLLLALQAIPDGGLLARYLVPGFDLGYTLGVLGLVLLGALVIATIWLKLDYQIWLRTHKAMGVAYVLGGMHAVVLQGDWYLILMTALGGYAWLYSLVLYRRFGPLHRGLLLQHTLKGSITELLIRCERRIVAHPGQFVFLRVPNPAYGVADEQHPFSISQIIDPQTIRVSVKQLGDYTRILPKLIANEQIEVFGPYGTFGDRYHATTGPTVWIAGGIGITPFLSMLHAVAAQAPAEQRPIHLIWAVRSSTDAVYDSEIMRLQAAIPQLHYQLHVSANAGHLTSAWVAQLVGSETLERASVLMCGPVPLMRGLRDQLQAEGKPATAIISEEFVLR